jgi:hypothetical protein
MTKLWQIAAAALIGAVSVPVWLGLFAGSARAQSGATCWQDGLRHLRASAPDGYAIYKQVGDPDFFKTWIRCDDAQFDLATAVHESTHFVTSEIDAYPLVGGGTIPIPHDVAGFYPPSRIAKRFRPDDFTTIYLRLGKASSSTNFLVLLDELNAYTHDLNAAVDLKDLVRAGESVDHRDGLAAMMAFVAVYAEVARESEPETWSALRQPTVATAVSSLWRQAERVMASSCGIPDFGTRDKGYIGQTCTAAARTALQPILGRAPICPTACLQSTTADEAADRSDPETRAEAPRRSVAGPSWIETIIHFQAKTNPPDEVTTIVETR